MKQLVFKRFDVFNFPEQVSLYHTQAIPDKEPATMNSWVLSMAETVSGSCRLWTKEYMAYPINNILKSHPANNHMKWLLILLLFIAAVGQRGGGGRSFGSFGSFRGGSRSSFFWGGSSMRASLQTCIAACNAKHSLNPTLLSPCIQSCNASNSRFVAVMVALIFGGCCAVCGCLACCRASNQPHNRQQFIQDTKERLHNISTNYMSLQQFELEREMFQKEDWKLFYFQQNTEHQNTQLSFSMRNQSPFLYGFTASGVDNLGRWMGSGYYFCTDSGIKLWMLKDYEDKEGAQQTGSFDLLMYEGQQVNRNRYEGTWYYVDHESDPTYVGKWVMVGRYEPKPVNPYLASKY